ncbi:MAG: ABC transporter substrate-binding protein [Burkholderiaceae bacterium]|jgi:phospholipid transport system substrate-binding protein|nr:ABC transporter substrate-binding protein [Burkholderiaceae bacterium]
MRTPFIKKAFPVFALWVFLFSTSAFAQQEAPDALVKRISQDVMQSAQKDKNVKKGDMKSILALVQAKIMPHVDFRKTTALAVGKYWRQATPSQRDALTKQFHSLLFYTYASAISKIEKNYKLEFKRSRAKPGDADVVVASRITQPGNPEPIELSYRLEKQTDGWKIYDINVMGAWLTESYKATFSSEIERGGVDGLIATLTEKNRGLSRQQGKTK